MYNGKRNSYISSPAQRRLPKKRRKSLFFSSLKRFIITYKNSLLVLIILGLLAIILQFAYIYTIGRPTNIISEVIFTDENIATYNHRDMYLEAREKFMGKNIIILKAKGNRRIKNDLEDTYHMIKDVSFSKTWPGKITVSLEFYPAQLLFKNSSLSIAYTNQTLFPTLESDTLNSGALVIRLPDYFSGEDIITNSTWYLALMWPEKLKDDFTLITNTMAISDILYLPWAQKSIIISENKKMTFDHKRSIQEQLQYLATILWSIDNNFYYEIDLTTFPRVIIKKQDTPFI